jgi:hypothetical protein
MLSQSVYSVGTAAITVVAPTLDAAHYVLKNLEPRLAPENYSRDGRVYDVFRTFPVNRGTSVSFGVTTGPTGCQFQYYQILSTESNIYSELIEGATVTFGTVIVPSFNVNRNNPDNAQSVFKNVTSFTGGTVVNSEYITASKAAGGEHSYTKVITLEPNSNYVFRFTEQTGTSDPTVFLQIGFSELYNGYDDIWLGEVNNSFVLRGGEEITMYLQPYETINATAVRDNVRLAVIRQD